MHRALHLQKSKECRLLVLLSRSQCKERKKRLIMHSFDIFIIVKQVIFL
jgi:hypothetical protein